MICSAHQPTYFPWLGLLDKIAKSDVFILVDDIKISKQSFQTRNIFWCSGKQALLSVPLKYNEGARFTEADFARNDWQADHLNKLNSYYRKAPYFRQIFPWLERYYNSDLNTPIDALAQSVQFCLDMYSIETKVVRSSGYDVSGVKGDWALKLCLAAGASDYLSGMGAYGYMQYYLQQFAEANVSVHWQHFSHPVYPQMPGFDFIEGLSSVDMLFFMGREEATRIFWENVDRTPSE